MVVTVPLIVVRVLFQSRLCVGVATNKVVRFPGRVLEDDVSPVVVISNVDDDDVASLVEIVELLNPAETDVLGTVLCADKPVRDGKPLSLTLGVPS